MKNILPVIVMTILMSLAVLTILPAKMYAEGDGVYIGVSGSYGLQNIDTADINNGLQPYGLSMTFGNSFGVNAKVGYAFSKSVAMEFDYSYVPNFSWGQPTNVSGATVNFDAKTQISTVMIAGKLSPDIGFEVVRPYITAGVGVMQGNIDVNGTGGGFSYASSNSKRDICAKMGFGIDFYATKHISIDTDGSYVTGFGNMNKIVYFNISLGATYHFY